MYPYSTPGVDMAKRALTSAAPSAPSSSSSTGVNSALADAQAQALAASDMGWWEWDITTGKLIYDGQWTVLLGQPEGTPPLSLTEARALFHPRDWAEAEQAVNEHLAGQRAFLEIEFRMRHRAGQWVWIAVRGKVLERDLAGRALRAVGTYRDLTRRKQLERSVERLSLAVNRGNVGIVTTDAQHRIEWFNNTFTHLVGCTKEEAMSRHPWDLLRGPSADPAVVAQIREQLDQGREVATDLHLTRRDGRECWLHVELSPVRDEGGRLVSFIGVLNDITERKLAEEKFRLLFEQSAGALLLFVDGRVHDCNQAAVQLLRARTKEELLHLPPEAFSPASQPDGRDSRVTWESACQLAQKHGSYRFEWVLRRLDLKDFPADTTLTPVALGSGSALLVAWHDLSERKFSEAALRQAMRAAETASLAKGEFLANMSHEIRTPMNAVLGMASLLSDTPLTAEQREYVDTIRLSGDALLSLLNHVLDFSKIESGKLDLEIMRFSPRQCVEEALDLLAGQAATKGLELYYVMESGVPAQVEGDLARLRQVLVNLVSNAVKFTHTGEIEVRVGLAPNEPSGVLHFSVRDTGIGIAPDRAKALFQPFTQMDNSMTRRFGGTGLGLAISKRLCQLMRGDLWLEPVKGPGSCFSFNVAMRPASSTPSPLPPPAWKDKNILIVESHAPTREMLAGLLKEWGLRPHAAAGAAAARSYLAHAPAPTAVLVGCQLGDGDGLALAGEWRQHYGPHFPVFMLGPLGQRNHRERAQALGLDFLPKPLKHLHLRDALAVHLSPPSTAAVPPVLDGADETSPPSTFNLRLLLAEDNTVNQRVARLLLRRFGCEADVAANGLEVLQALQRKTYDVILLDIQMPEMDGLEAARHLRASLPPTVKPYLIALTASATLGDQAACRAAGIEDYLTKPLHAHDLEGALRRAQEWLAVRTGPEI